MLVRDGPPRRRRGPGPRRCHRAWRSAPVRRAGSRSGPAAPYVARPPARQAPSVCARPTDGS